MRALDEIDYGVILLDGRRMVWHTNHLARIELNRGQVLHVHNGELDTRVANRQSSLKSAIGRAGQGIRSMVDLRPSHGDHSGTSIAFVPMGHPAECFPDPLPVLGITCRPVLCEQISLHFFAQSYGLTRTEELVLMALVQGLEVEDIVRERSLAMSTVRSHVKQLRIKTQSGSMRELLNKVSVLPPVVSSIKSF
jgi:DNA-binding CsgD family transcriptional regulator